MSGEGARRAQEAAMEGAQRHPAEQFDRVLAPGEAVAFVVPSGWRLRLYQVEQQQVADLVSFALDDPDERLSMYMSRAVNLTWKLTEGHVLVSTDGRDLWTIERDTVRENYSGGGYCNPAVNGRRYDRADAPTCETNLAAALAPFGLGRRSFDADTCLNVFMRVDYEPDGSWLIREPPCVRGDEIVLRSEREQVVGLSNCPQVLNAANAFSLKPLGVQLSAADGGDPHEPGKDGR